MSQLIVKPKFSEFINSPAVIKGTLASLSDAKKERFVASIISAVSTNPALRDCDNSTILSSAMLGLSLDLSPSPSLGHFYFLPFDDRKNNRKVATFVLGYKGYVQLAIRSGCYKTLNALSIKQGELISYNPLTEELQVKLEENEEKRSSLPTIGYYAFFEHVNGFKKAIYWSKQKTELHAMKFSKGYSAKKGYTFWEKDFDSMALKTIIRQLLSKWGILSIDMQMAYEKDMTSDDGSEVIYPENETFSDKTIDETLFSEQETKQNEGN